MPKPIVVITLPYGVSQCQRAEFSKHCDHVGITNEYWVLAFHGDTDTPQIQVFYEKDFNQVKYDELCELIKNRFK